MDDLRLALQAYYKDERFTDFAIEAANGVQHKVHRCFVAAQSKYFSAYFSRSFTGNPTDPQVYMLHEAQPEAVACMIEYIYTFDYQEYAHELPPDRQIDLDCSDPWFPMQLHARVYKIAAAYEVEGLKQLALQKFKKAGALNLHDKAHMTAAAMTIYDKIEPGLQHFEYASTLRRILVDMWVVASKSLLGSMSEEELQSFYARVPAFAADFAIKMMGNVLPNRKVTCSNCNLKLKVPGPVDDDTTSTTASHECDTDFVRLIHECKIPTGEKENVKVRSAVQIRKFW